MTVSLSPRPIPALNIIASHLATSARSIIESDILRDHWAHGDDAWLREDPRFRPTPWGRWILSSQYLVNDLLVSNLRNLKVSELNLKDELGAAAKLTGVANAFCEADPRLRIDGDRVRLAPAELGHEPLLEDAMPLQQYTTHLPVLTLLAAAASEPAGEWGRSADPQHVEPRGWLRIESAGRPLNRRMFVARIKGASMDDGHRGIVDGAWSIFEFVFQDSAQYGRPLDEPIVLARGAFNDPESGAYAVKRWHRAPEKDEGDAVVRLVSLNPDKERFPDIVIPEAEDLRVVAGFERVLRPGDFARRPRTPRLPGRRPIGKDALDTIGAQLQRRLASFFDGAPIDEGDVDDALPEQPAMRPVCLAASDGAFQIEVGPLPQLEPFIKRVRVVSNAAEQVLIASNLRLRPGQVTMPPGSGPWHLEAVGFEEDVDLSNIRYDALPVDAVAVFRVDASGDGRLQKSFALATGQEYRILVPPQFTAHMAGENPGVTDLPGGWYLWEVTPELPCSTMTVDRLSALGLSIGEASPRLECVVIAPVAWRTTDRGAVFPVFQPGDIVIQVSGCNIDSVGNAAIFLHGPSGTERLELPPGSEALLNIGPLTLGRHAISLLHRRSRVPAANLLFEVAQPAPPMAGRWTVTASGALIAHPSGDVIGIDLPEVASDTAPVLGIVAPPGWPVRITWRDLNDYPLGTAHADEDGNLDLDHINAKLVERMNRHPLGDIRVDLGDAGLIIGWHERRAGEDSIQTTLARLVAERGALVRGQSGAWLKLGPLWFTPVLDVLGYQLDAENPCADAPDDLAVWPLLVDERVSGGLRRSVRRLLVLAVDLDGACSHALGPVNALCRTYGVEVALLSDGLRWRAHRRGSKRRRRTWDLSVDLSDPAALDPLLGDLAENV